jgi:hypothetical protein
MKSFAIILLSNGTFGGAQRRFTNLFLEFRLRRRLNAYFIVTPSMKRQIAEIYGDQALDGILTIGDEVALLDTSAFVSSPLSKSKIAGPKRALLKQSIVYKIYYYFKTKRIQFKQFKEINHLAKQYEIDRFLAVYTGVLPLYFYLNRHKNRPRIVFSNSEVSYLEDLLFLPLNIFSKVVYEFREICNLNHIAKKRDCFFETISFRI